LLVAGSTHPGEEAILGDVFIRLRERFPDLYLIVVPRHFERGKEAGRDLSARGVKFAYRSELSVTTKYKPNEFQCLLVNTNGELKYFYEQAEMIFVGKSLAAVAPRDGRHDKKSQSGSLDAPAGGVRDPIEALENPFQFGGRNSDAVITDLQYNCVDIWRHNIHDDVFLVA